MFQTIPADIPVLELARQAGDEFSNLRRLLRGIQFKINKFSRI